MKLSEWARKQGIAYLTAYRWFKAGKLSVPAQQTATGTILVQDIPLPTNTVALYGRYSSAEQKENIERQMQRLRDYAAANGLDVVREVQEIGSGLNGRRGKLLKLLADPSINTIIVEHRDRLTRFGSEYIEAALARSNAKVLVINQSEFNDDLVQDMTDVLTSMCARLYGRRGARNRAKRLVKMCL